jgi:hypothetical protein
MSLTHMAGKKRRVGDLTTVSPITLSLCSKITNTNLTAIPDNTFSDMGSLTYFELAGNLITDIGPSAFTNMTRLATLYVFASRVHFFKPPPPFLSPRIWSRRQLDAYTTILGLRTS